MIDLIFLKIWSCLQVHVAYNYTHIRHIIEYWNYLNCIFGIEYRQQGRFAGFSIYVSDTGVIQGSNLCYKDGPQLPPLNFTTTCREYGRFVIFHNERKDEVVYPHGYELSNMYTELCEVIVKCKYTLKTMAAKWDRYSSALHCGTCNMF